MPGLLKPDDIKKVSLSQQFLNLIAAYTNSHSIIFMIADWHITCHMHCIFFLKIFSLITIGSLSSLDFFTLGAILSFVYSEIGYFIVIYLIILYLYLTLYIT